MIGLALAIMVFVCCLLPAVMLAANWRAYKRLPDPCSAEISLLIPARNEELSIEQAVRSAMKSQGVTLEIIVLDDDSTDNTANIVRRLSIEDPHVRLESAPPLPDGWCGKQHACWILSKLARYDLLVWIDADVRLEPEALARMAQFIAMGKSGLISGVPRQLTGTISESLIIPLIHFVLLGYLPIQRMRATTDPAFAAGCGQLFMARRAAYEKPGGHAAIRASLHDGITLPRAFRRAGIATDLFDATDVTNCRMYRGVRQVFNGFTKNATEGMATPKALPVWTVLLSGHAIPWVVSPILLIEPNAIASIAARWLWHASFILSISTTAMLARRFRQGVLSCMLHPIGVGFLLFIQWYALLRKLAGYGTQWKSRRYASGPARPGSVA
jgi:glycosyltransferase involved in cell wall biosynthesis